MDGSTTLPSFSISKCVRHRSYQVHCISSSLFDEGTHNGHCLLYVCRGVQLMGSVLAYHSPDSCPFGAQGSSAMGSGMPYCFWWLKCWLAPCLLPYRSGTKRGRGKMYCQISTSLLRDTMTQTANCVNLVVKTCPCICYNSTWVLYSFL